MDKSGYVYILTNNHKTVLYTGVTSDLEQRIYEHKEGLTPGFATRYNCSLLVFYEIHNDVESAIKREKQIKKWKREWKENLISAFNPNWIDLSDQIQGIH